MVNRTKILLSVILGFSVMYAKNTCAMFGMWSDLKALSISNEDGYEYMKQLAVSAEKDRREGNKKWTAQKARESLQEYGIKVLTPMNTDGLHIASLKNTTFIANDKNKENSGRYSDTARFAILNNKKKK